jgi:hypothetical protein
MTTETTTPATRTPFPERMHAKSVETNTRRAENALNDLIERATLLRKRMENGSPAGPESSYDLSELATRVGVHLSALEVLREHIDYMKPRLEEE